MARPIWTPQRRGNPETLIPNQGNHRHRPQPEHYEVRDVQINQFNKVNITQGKAQSSGALPYSAF